MLFGLLNVPAVQEYAKEQIEKELKSKLNTELGIGKLQFQPFSTIALDSVYLYDQSDERILLADRISADVDLFSLLKGKIVITSAWLSDFEIRLSKQTSDSPLNIQYIIDAFKPKDDKPSKKIEFAINSVNVIDGNFYYDVKDKEAKENAFDPNHIQVSDLHAKLTLRSLHEDSLNIQVKKISLKEKSGLEISNLVFRLMSQEKKYSIRGFKLDLPASHLELERCELDLTPTSDTAKIMDYATVDLKIAESKIGPKDIAALSPALQYFKDAVTLKAEVSGNIDDLDIKDLSLFYGKNLKLISNAEIKDIRFPDKTYILGSVDKLMVTSDELEGILNNFSDKKKQLPQTLKRLGTISFEGDISGYLKQLTTFGSFETDLGIVKADVLVGLNPKANVKTHIQGKIYTTDFEVGKLTGNNNLGSASLNLSVDMEQPKYGKLRGSAQGNVYDLQYKNYTYKDINLDIDYDGMKADGNINLDDPNGLLAINGLFDLTDKDNPNMVFKARLKNVHLNNLNLLGNEHNTYLSLNIDADFKGKDIDNAEGYIRLDSLDYIRDDKYFQMKKFLMEITGDQNNRNMNITSDVLKGKIEGIYSFTTLVNSVKQTLSPYLPALIKPNEKKKPDDKTNIFTFNLQIGNTEKLSEAFKLPVTVLSEAKIIGFYDNIRDKFKLEIFTPSIKAAGMNIRSGYVALRNPDETLESRINALILGKKESVNDIAINSSIKDNQINTNISLINDGEKKAKGDFSISTSFAKEDKGPLIVDIDTYPSELLLNNANWKMEKSNIKINNGTFTINNFYVYNENGDQEIKINGRYSPQTRDVLKTDLKNINLEYIFQTLAIDALQFGGYATGSLRASSIEGNPYANISLDVDDFKFNGTELGNLNLFSELNETTKVLDLDGLIVSKESKLTKVNGQLDPIKQGLSINFDADSLDISFLNKYAEAVFDNITGRGSGQVHLFGNFSDVTVEGKAFIRDGGLGISFLNTRYNFTDTVYLKKDLIYFNDIILSDQYGNKAQASGKVSHDFFHDFMYQVDLKAENFLLYNTTPAQNPYFYGKVFGSGNGSIGGNESAVDVAIRMRTEDKTVVRMNFMEEIINEYSFITYTSDTRKDSVQTPAAPQPKLALKTDSDMDINMDFYIDATPDAIVELVMDPVGGDVLRGSGSGGMQFNWNTKNSPRLYGTYNIARGSYNFTFQRLMERRFSIQEGSNVQFRGDPFEAILDVTAIYKLNASLHDLDSQLAEEVGQTTVPVNCVLNLTGALRHPNVGLDITFPSADPEVERQLKSIINTEDEINKQVAYLLILSKFKAPSYAVPGTQTSDFAAVASATLSNQLTKIVSQIDDRWQLGTNIRYSDSDLTYTEAELILSSQLLNDRLLINGNFGYRSDINKEAMITDVDIEYLLNNAGTWRVKAYNHYNEKYYYTRSDKSPNTQGIGIIYKKDFDDLNDLFHRRRMRILPQTDTVTTIVPDSTKKGSELSNFIKLKTK
ncbi:translocation/assembly module TamB [Dysgonomonas sp. 511]|nr:translocation/assembly module TamB [Dysgonomonas sp. 511]